jgi:hypothetical protein
LDEVMTDNARETGAAVEAHFQSLMWLVPAVAYNRRMAARRLNETIQR